MSKQYVPILTRLHSSIRHLDLVGLELDPLASTTKEQLAGISNELREIEKDLQFINAKLGEMEAMI